MSSSPFIVNIVEMKTFFYLTEDPTIQKFLKMDGCRLIADKGIVKFPVLPEISLSKQLQEYLANCVEEDEEDFKYEIPFALGISSCKEQFRHFHKLRDMLFKRMGYRAIVSRKCCEEIMAIEPEHELWKRSRPPQHGGAIRPYKRNSSNGIVCGPHLCQDAAPSEFLGPDDIWRSLEHEGTIFFS